MFTSVRLLFKELTFVKINLQFSTVNCDIMHHYAVVSATGRPYLHSIKHQLQQICHGFSRNFDRKTITWSIFLCFLECYYH